MEPYPIDEFLEHFADWRFVRDYHHVTIGSSTAPISGERDFTARALRTRDYMQQRYGDTREAAEKAKLFSLIQFYLAEHASEFDRSSLAVCGTEQGLISQHLLRAAHHFFTRQPLAGIGMGPPVTD